jgi:hypothetical protein
MVHKRYANHGGMAEWLKAAVLKTVERKFRGFESYSLRQIESELDFLPITIGEMTELAEGARLLSECGGKTSPRVRIPLSPPSCFAWRSAACSRLRILFSRSGVPCSCTKNLYHPQSRLLYTQPVTPFSCCTLTQPCPLSRVLKTTP